MIDQDLRIIDYLFSKLLSNVKAELCIFARPKISVKPPCFLQHCLTDNEITAGVIIYLPQLPRHITVNILSADQWRGINRSAGLLPQAIVNRSDCRTADRGN